jgi:hypothetical protein
MQMLHLDNDESSQFCANEVLISPSTICGFLDQDRQLSKNQAHLNLKITPEIGREGENMRHDFYHQEFIDEHHPKSHLPSSHLPQ